MEPAEERQCWQVVDSLPLSVRVAERLADVLILASEIEADVASEEGVHLRWIAGDVEEVSKAADRLLLLRASRARAAMWNAPVWRKLKKSAFFPSSG